MIAGLPGTGLGGIFYLVAAVVVILRDSVRLARGERQLGPALLKLTLITLGIVVMLGATYWVLGELLALQPVVIEGAGAAGGASGGSLRLPPLLIATLPMQLSIIVLLVVSLEIVGSVLSRRSGRLPQSEPDASKPH